MRQVMRRRRYPSLLMRLRRRAGFCSHDWRRAVCDADIEGRGHHGEDLGGFTLALCERHLDDYTRAITSVPHHGEAKFASGATVRWDAR